MCFGDLPAQHESDPRPSGLGGEERHEQVGRVRQTRPFIIDPHVDPLPGAAPPNRDGGAALGGLLLGILEQVGPNLLLTGYGIPSPNQLQDVIAFTVLVLVLIFRPSGLLGRKENM